MSKETLLKIGQIGCTALAGFLGICLTQLNINKAVDEKVKALGMSLTQMQKQIGNSIDVNVIRRIYNNLFCYC